MKFIADFHIHSHHSMATSKKLIPEYLDYWAKVKGINVLGTGDCLHPGWFNELKEKLEPTANGLYRLKKSSDLSDPELPKFNNHDQETFFILSTEISSIYKKNGKVRKVHNICIFPNFDTAEQLQSRLSKLGNIQSDGRPILGLDSKNLLEMLLETSTDAFMIPAHIWTPWFSVLGSKSGFDNLEECFEDLTPYIFAVETGLSSDPPMNRACSFLDKFRLVSNSDAHSPEKLGREANIFDTELSYKNIYNSLKKDEGFLGTIEFFPQEGKYHYDGHRKCNIRWDPLQTIQNKAICPVCNKPVTKGVLYRVAELADSQDIHKPEARQKFQSITPLPDIIAEILAKKSSSKMVRKEYWQLIEKLGPEFHILLKADLSDIKKVGGEIFLEAIKRLRAGEVHIEEGFDGEFGQITMFEKDELTELEYASLFPSEKTSVKTRKEIIKSAIRFDISAFQVLHNKKEPAPEENLTPATAAAAATADKQQSAIEHKEGACLILAGPGTGKTKILTERIVHLITDYKVEPQHILGITFSNKACAEMKSRISKKISKPPAGILTFHAFGLSILKKYYQLFGRNEKFHIIDSAEKKEIVQHIKNIKKRTLNKTIKQIENYKQGAESIKDLELALKKYDEKLEALNAFDLEDLIFLPVQLFITHPEILEEYKNKHPWILIDEYQDINTRQYEMIRLLTSQPKPNLFAIGDPDQAIYGFRGSDLKFIEKFKEDYPGLKITNLNKSYRCPSSILKAGSQILKKKKYLEGKPSAIKIHIEACETEKSEADFIASQIEKMLGGVRSFSLNSGISDGTEFEDISSFADFAVLCRTTTLFEPLITAFNNHGIAYQIIGLEPFYKKEPLAAAIRHFKELYYLAENKKTSPDNLYVEIKGLLKRKKSLPLIMHRLCLAHAVPPSEEEQLLKLTEKFGTDYADFLRALSTRQGIDDYEEEKEAVSLMTLHAAKGLEFKTVFIPACEKNIIPFELFTKKTKEELQEEERLFYVGITRSEKYLFLSHARKRLFRKRSLKQQKSPLIKRLQQELLTIQKRAPRKNLNNCSQLPLFEL